MKYNYGVLISSLSVMALLYSLAPDAAILDGGEIQFSGFVSDDTPKWTWQVASPEQIWAVDTADARSENGQLVFDLGDKGSVPFLEGRLYQVAERGGPGFTPLISFSSSGQPFSMQEGGRANAQHFRAMVPVRDPARGNTVGQLWFTLDQGMAVSAGQQDAGVAIPAGMSLVTGQSVMDVQTERLPRGIKNRLSSLLLMNRGFGNGMSAGDNQQVISQRVLADGRVRHLAAAYAASVSDFELRLPVEGTPSQWQAGLSVTVTVQ